MYASGQSNYNAGESIIYLESTKPLHLSILMVKVTHLWCQLMVLMKYLILLTSWINS